MATNSPKGDVIRLMTHVLGATFGGPTWATWRAVLKAAHALALIDDERAIVHELTQRAVLPSSPVRELWLLLGRRSGKSIVAALLAVWATCCRTYSLAPGEVGVFMVVAADRRQARVVKKYIAGLLRSHPSLALLIARETKESIALTNGLVIEIHTCSYRTVRGYTCVGAAVDEVAFWDSEDSANPDHEVLVALKAAMASVPEAMLIGLTSVYARRGETWRIFDKHFGRNDSANVLVVNGKTRAFNPTIQQQVIDEATEDDPIAAAAEYGAEFRRDVELFLPLESVEAVCVSGRSELPPAVNTPSGRPRYVAFLDPAGGTGTDSMTLAIAHLDRGCAVLDCVRERKPPFSPESVVDEYSEVMASYHVTKATADRYAGSWPTEAFKKRGITVSPSEKTRSDIYLTALPMITSGRVELLDHSKLTKQLSALERRTSRQGRDTVDHPPRQHDDVANAACGALVLTTTKAKGRVSVLWSGDDINGAATTVSPDNILRRSAVVFLPRRGYVPVSDLTTDERARLTAKGIQL